MSTTTRETDGCGGPPPELQVLFTQQPATTDSRCHPPTVKLIGLLPRKLQRNYATRARGEISRQRWSEPSRFLGRGPACGSRHRGGFTTRSPRFPGRARATWREKPRRTSRAAREILAELLAAGLVGWEEEHGVDLIWSASFL
jgi:hypothetical protein